MEPILDPVLQYGAFGLCVMLIALLSWIVKKQANTIDNHLEGLQRSLDNLPCRRGADCSVKESE